MDLYATYLARVSDLVASLPSVLTFNRAESCGRSTPSCQIEGCSALRTCDVVTKATLCATTFMGTGWRAVLARSSPRGRESFTASRACYLDAVGVQLVGWAHIPLYLQLNRCKYLDNSRAGIGNSVPPLMTRAIARHIRATIPDRA